MWDLVQYLPPLSPAGWAIIANSGDVAVIAPCAAAVAILLVIQRRGKETVGWLVGFAVCAAAILVSKATLGSFRLTILGQIFRADGFPSGHVGLSTALYGGLALLVWSTARAWVSIATAALATAFVLLIGAAVCILGWHHTLDVLGGLMVGLASLSIMAGFGAARPRSGAEIAAILTAVAVVGIATHGLRLDELRTFGPAAMAAAPTF